MRKLLVIGISLATLLGCSDRVVRESHSQSSRRETHDVGAMDSATRDTTTRGTYSEPSMPSDSGAGTIEQQRTYQRRTVEHSD